MRLLMAALPLASFVLAILSLITLRIHRARGMVLGGAAGACLIVSAYLREEHWLIVATVLVLAIVTGLELRASRVRG
jgi:hypothetical protein